MNSAAKGLLGFSVTAILAISCAPLKNSAASSGLSSVTIGDFKTESNMTAWKSGKLQFKKLGSESLAVNETFKSGSNTLQNTVSMGSYTVSLEYFEDEAGKILLYKACPEPSSNINFTFSKENESISIEVCDKNGKAIGTTVDTSNVTVNPTARKSSSGTASTNTTNTGTGSTTTTGTASTTPTATAGASNFVSYSMSSKAGTEANSVEVSYTITNTSGQDLYCHYRPLILFKDVANNFGVEINAPVKIAKGETTTAKVETFNGMKVLNDASKAPVVSELKLYGMCRPIEADAKSMFASSCMKDAAAACDSFVKK